MTHAHTKRLIETWRSSRGDRRLPPRVDISPAALGPLLPQVFILGETGADDGWRFRLAGGFVNDLFARDLRGASFLSLFGAPDRAGVEAALHRARASAEPVVLKVLARGGDGRVLGLELTLAPATGPTEAADRILGLVQPTSAMGRLAGAPVTRLHLAGSDAAPAPSRLRLVVDNT